MADEDNRAGRFAPQPSGYDAYLRLFDEPPTVDDAGPTQVTDAGWDPAR